MRHRLLLALPLLLVLAAARAAPERVALVIGNAGYPEAPLANTRNDAADMAAKLRGLGFTVDLRQDLGRRDFSRAAAEFVRRVRGSDAAALFYFSGHGLQVGGRNFLVPVDARIGDELDVAGEAYPVDDLPAGLDGRGAGAVNLIVLDACRHNPYKRPDQKAIGDKGLARVNIPAGGTLVLYATRPGETASDNPGGRNGLFTAHLLSALDQPGVEVEAAFKQVAMAVYDASRHTQSPWSEGVIFGHFWFVPPAPLTPSVPDPVPPPPASAPAVGHLQVSVDAPGSTVKVNGRELGQAGPGEALDLTNLAAGTVQVEVTAPGRETVIREAQVRPGAWTQLALSLPALGPKTGDTWIEPWTKMVFVRVPGGSFTMGCWGPGAGGCSYDQKPAKRLYICDLWIARTEVTQGQ